jgi:hypothetical protein
MTALRKLPASLVIVGLVGLVAVALAAVTVVDGANGDLANLARLRIQPAALLLAVAAWPVLAARALRRAPVARRVTPRR